MVQRGQTNSYDKRSSLLTAFLLLCFGLILWRLFDLQVINGAVARKQAESLHSVYVKLTPSRGEIKIIDKTSLEEFPLATNIKAFLVYAVPKDVTNSSLTAASLASVLGLPAPQILDKISDLNRKYVPLKKQLSEAEQQKIQDLKLPGIYLDSEDTRYYPEKNLLSQTLGFVGFKGDQKVGLYGLERYFEKDLAGTPGELRQEKDTTGAWIFGSNREMVPATDGTNLILTVDKSIQFKAESVLADTVTKHGADSGSIIVADPKTGAILAMAGYPDFDLNQYGKVTDPSLYTNQATTGNYEPGSTFKAITMVAALDEGKVTPDTTYVDTGKVVVDNYTIKNAEPGARGVQTMTQVLDESLNTGAIFAKQQIGNDDFLKYVKKFGFGAPTGIELPETKGNLENLKYNIEVNFDTASFGQGIATTPVQMIQAYTALANSGKMMRPYIVQSKVAPDGTAVVTKPAQVAQVISDKAAHTISAMLVDVVENGYGRKAAVPGYYIAGKTGTSQVPGPDGKYLENDNIGSFIGYGPVEDPQFVMLVRINHPRDVKFAETTAAPAFGQMAQFILNYLHVSPTRNVGK